MVAVALAFAALFLLAIAPAAMAAPKSIQGFIGAGSPLPPNTPEDAFSQPRDVVVYEGTDNNPSTDKIFVVEDVTAPFVPNSHFRVQRFGATGNFELIWGKDVVAGNADLGYEVCTVSCKSGGLGTAKGEFDDPTGLAVDQASGWVYVFDRDNLRIQKFDVNGNFVAAFGKAVNETTGGDVCTQASGNACKAGAAGNAAGQFAAGASNISKLAVNPVSGDVFAADPGNRRVNQFDAAGNFLRAWGYGVDTGANNQFQVCTALSSCQAGVTPSAANANGSFAASNPLNLAVDSQGVVYATDTASSTVANRIIRFDSDLAPVSGDASGALLGPINPTTGPASNPLLAGTSPGIEIDRDSDGAGPDEESLLAVRDPASGNTLVQELDIPTQVGELSTDAVTVVLPDGNHTFAPQAVNGGLGVNGVNGNIYLPATLSVAQFPACGLLLPSCAAASPHGLFVLNILAGGLDADAETLDTVGARDATLKGTLDVNGPVRYYHFEIAKGGAAFAPTGSPVRISGGADIPVSQSVTGLDPNSIYRFRLVISTVDSLTTLVSAASPEVIFITQGIKPDVTTLAPSPRSDTGAGLQARLNPNGAATTYRFEYGTTTGYGSKAPIPDANAGAGAVEKTIVQPISGLQPNTTYHYRIVAENQYGTSPGGDVSFTTRVTPGASGTRAYEMVSPPYKMTGPGLGNYGSHSELEGESGLTTGMASVNGERFIFPGGQGPVLTPGATVVAEDIGLASRTPEGWVSGSAFNRQNYSGNLKSPLLAMAAASEDFSTLVFDNYGGDVRLFPEMATPEWAAKKPQYLRTWNGKWEALAPTAPGQQGADGSATALSDDGKLIVATHLQARGLLGTTDPSLDLTPGSRATYLYDKSAGLTDALATSGPTELLGTCSPGTLIPVRLASGKQDAQTCPAPAVGRATSLISTRGSSISPTEADVQLRNVVSRNGSRVFFMSPDPVALDPDGSGSQLQTSGSAPQCGTATGPATSCPPQLYIRQKGSDGSILTRWISQATIPNQDVFLLGPAIFEGASEDGDKVFFRTTSPLTADDRNGGGTMTPGGVTGGAASSNSWDLYMYDLPDGPDGNAATPDADPAGGTLTRISSGPDGGDPDSLGDGDCNSPLGGAGSELSAALRYVSADGARAYFVCAAPLPGVADPANGTITSPGGTVTTTTTANLYLFDATRAGNDRWRFIARLPRSTSFDALATCASTGYASGEIRNTVTSSRVFALFGGPRNCVRGSADGSLVTFWTDGRLTADDPDAVSGDVYAYGLAADELVRISAPQGGSGGSYLCATGNAGGDVLPESERLRCHGDMGFKSFVENSNHERGSLRGIATDPQTGEDSAFFESRSRLTADDTDDAMDVYEWRQGKLSLLSAGTSQNAHYTGNSADGQDVFILASDRLSWEDVDATRDVYDIRVGGGFPEPVAPVLCSVLGDGCQPAPSAAPQTPSQPTSAGTTGAGNVTGKQRKPSCGKGKVRRGGKCVAKKQKRAQRTNTDRRAGK
jgi:hypothetical protein